MAGRKGGRLYASGHYFAGSDYTGMRNYSGNWGGNYAPREGANLAFLFSRVEIGASQDSWQVSALYRKDILIASGRDFTDLIHANKNRLPLPVGKNIPIEYRLDGFEAEGISLAKGFQFDLRPGDTLSVGIGVALLRGMQVATTTASGLATVTTPATYAYSLSYHDANTSKTFPFISSANQIGSGYSVDLGMRLMLAGGGKLDVTVGDLLGEMRWKNIPATRFVANNNTTGINADGFIIYQPALSGQNSRINFVQRLHPKMAGHYSFPYGAVRLGAGSAWTENNWFPQVTADWAISQRISLESGYDLRLKTVKLGVRHNWFRLQVQTSSANLEQARAYGISGGLSIPF